MLFSLLESNTVDPGLEIVRYRKRKICFPLEVVNVIFMKMDRAVLVRQVSPTHLSTIPVGPRHCASGKIHQLAAQLVGACIDNTTTGYVA